MRYLTAGMILALLFLAAGVAAPAAAQTRIHLPEEERPPVLEIIGEPEGLTTLTISSDGESAAAALVGEEEPVRSTVLLYSTAAAEPARLELNGRVRDLLFGTESRSVLALLHRPAKKREGDTYLMRIEVDPLRARRVMRLPPSARSLDFWPARNALLVASRNEIRTMTFPELRSGPLYRVTGENLSVASLGAAGMILVGQESALLLIDLDDPPGEVGMPVRERVASTQAVLSLAAAADGSRALARLADGAVHGVELHPLRLAATGAAGPVAASEKPLPAAPVAAPEDDPVEAAPDEPAVPAEAETATPATQAPPPLEEEAADVPPARLEEQAVAPAVPALAETEAPATQTPPPPEEEAADVPPAAEEEAAPPPPAETETRKSPERERQIRGRISGPAAGQVVAVVFLGPDNVLREALRVVPGEDGGWSADGLAPGRYRVQLDGGGSRVIVSEPPFLLLDLAPDAPTDAGEIRALQAL